MRILAWLAVVACVLLAIVLGYRWFENSLAADRRKAIDESISDFHQHESQYAALIPAWRNAYGSSDPCGLSAPSLGMVQFHIFAVTENGAYRVTVNGNDKVLPSLSEAAAALNTKPDNVQSLVAGLRSVSRSAVYQHDAEVKVPGGANYGVLFVPSSCSQASRYEAESRPGATTSFVNLIALGGGWYYYAERR